MGVRKSDPIEKRKLARMRQANTAVTSRHGLGGQEKKGQHAPRQPSLPKLPWDDELGKLQAGTPSPVDGKR